MSRMSTVHNMQNYSTVFLTDVKVIAPRRRRR